MRLNFRFSGVLKYAILFAAILFTISLTGQQNISAPMVTLVSPAAGDSLNNSGLILLKAEVISGSPIRSYKVFNDREPVVNETGKNLKRKDSTSYIIETNLPLKKGQNIIYLEVRNGSSTTVSDKRYVLSQIEPFVKWILPAETNSTTQSASITLKAEIRTLLPIQTLNLNLNGTAMIQDKEAVKSTGSETYLFEKNIQLSPGKNTISLNCSNARGSTNSLQRIITNAYTTAPRIILISPAVPDSLNNTGLATVKATIESKSPLKSFRLYNNDEIVVSESGKKLEQKDSITYILDSFVPLKRGYNVLFIQATNGVGTGNSEKRKINSKLEPFVTWLMPNLENSDVESENITLRAEIKSGTALKKTIININGVSITDDKAGVTPPDKDTYLLEKSILLKSGKNIIFISSVNARGETRSAVRYVNCTAGATPVITLVSPLQKDSLNNSGLITINAEIVSKFDLQSYRIFNNRNVVMSETAGKLEKKDSITYLVKSFVPLQTGLNTIFVEARNSAGMGTSARRNITCQLEPIINWILPSSLMSNFDSGNMTIKAEIKTSFDLSVVSININGNSTTIDKGILKQMDNSTWIIEKSISLGAGTNNLSLIASNIKGSGKSPVRQVNYVPGVKPEINWIEPSASNMESEKPEYKVSATIRTKNPIKSTRLFINGTELESAGGLKVTQKSAQEYLYENNAVLRPGENMIKLMVTTGEATVNSEDRIINYTAPVLPELTWKNPTPGQGEVSKPTLNLLADIKSPGNINSITVYLNGQAVENISLSNSVRRENSIFIFENKIDLKPGDNSIYLAASNNAGSAKSETRNIKFVVPAEPVVAAIATETKVAENKVAEEKVNETRPPDIKIAAAPVLTWISPSVPKNNIDQNNAKIKLKISSADKLQAVMIYVNGVASNAMNDLTLSASQDEYILEKLVSLNPGENNLYMVATNSGGTTKSDLRYLTNPPTNPPLISWAIPSEPKAIVSNEIVMIEVCIKSATDLKSAMIYVNGIPQVTEMMFPSPLQGDCNYRLVKPVILKEGKNSLIVNATNFAGSNNSESREILYQTTLIAEKRLALVFGNSDYGNSGTLKNPVNDANLIEGTLKTLGFEVIKRLNAKKIEMEQAIREFSEKLPEYNVALFYYAGHGMNVEGANYLLPTDAVLTKKTDCQWEAIEVNKIVAQFEQVPENINIIILDACRNNPFKSWVRGGEQGFKMLNPVSGTFISYATAEGATAADGSGLNGPFTEELVKQMVVPQSIFEVFINAGNQVRKRTNNTQQPTYQVNLSGNFWFKK